MKASASSNTVTSTSVGYDDSHRIRAQTRIQVIDVSILKSCDIEGTFTQ